MRLTAIVLLILCINLSNALFTTMDVFVTQPVGYDQQLIDNLNSSVTNTNYLGSNVQSQESAQIGVGDFIAGLWYFTQVFFQGVILPFTMLANFGVIPPYNTFFSIPIYFIYLVTFINFIRGGFFD